MHALVTGGAGFIGSTLVDRLLAEGHHVDVLDDLRTGSLGNLAGARELARIESAGRLKIHQIDVTDEGAADVIAHRGPDVVFHLAGPTRKRPRTAVEQARHTLTGALRVLEGAVAGGTGRVVFTAGARAQADALRGIPDRAVHEYLEAFRHRHGLAHVTVVLPTVYGPRQTSATESSVVAVLVERTVAAQACVLHGGGAQTRDLLYVDDAVDALVRAAGAAEALDGNTLQGPTDADGLVIEAGVGGQTSVRDLHVAIVEAAARAGCEAPPDAVDGEERSGEPGRVEVSASSAETVLGWEPWTALGDGLDATVADAISRAART